MTVVEILNQYGFATLAAVAMGYFIYFIYKFTKDADYRDNKEKVKSLVPLNNINAYPHIRTKLGDDKLKLVLDDGRYWYNKDDIPDDVMNDVKRHN